MTFSRVVILGHTGFVGAALERYYRERGAEVIGHSTATLDLRSPDAARVLAPVVNAQTVVVLASAITRDRGDTLTSLLDNIAIAASVARLLVSHPVGLCAYLSTDGIYSAAANPVREDSPLDPVGFYPLAKFTGERLLERTAQVAGVPVLILRPTAIYGPGDTHVNYGPNQFVRSLVTERVVRLFGGGEERRDHLFIDDAVTLIARLIEAQATGIYNLASGHSCSFADVVEVLRRVVPHEFEVTSVPRKATVTHRHFDVTRLFLAAPDARFTPLEEGLRRFYDACVK
ncbi:MAG: NAD-dependent epimerase/dehydratase family protein [Candidatus Rokuibacteriota bacterium]